MSRLLVCTQAHRACHAATEPKYKPEHAAGRRALKRADLHLREDPETGCREVDAGNSLPRLEHV